MKLAKTEPRPKAAMHPTPAEVLAEYAYALADLAVAARKSADEAIDAMEQARAQAERALRRCEIACELAERWAVFAARAEIGDADPLAVHEAMVAIGVALSDKKREAA